MQGWIKLHRKICDHWLYQEERSFSRYEAWLDLLILANHKTREILLGNEVVKVERGSFVTSELKLMRRWKWGKTKVRNFLALLEKEQMIIRKADRKKTTIHLCNYNVYQSKTSLEEPQRNGEIPTDKQQKYINKNEKTVKNIKEDEEETHVVSYTEKRFDHRRTEARHEHRKTTKSLAEDGPREMKTALYIYKQNFGELPPILQQSFQSWCEELGEELVIFGIEQAARHGGKTYQYCEAIWQEWFEAGVTRLKDVQEFLQKRNKQKSNMIPFPNRNESDDVEALLNQFKDVDEK